MCHCGAVGAAGLIEAELDEVMGAPLGIESSSVIPQQHSRDLLFSCAYCCWVLAPALACILGSSTAL